MGGCVGKTSRKSQSSPAPAPDSAGAPRRRRRRGFRRRVAASRKAMVTIEEGADHRVYSNPAFQAPGIAEEAWYDSYAVIESDEEDFLSVQEDAFSLNGFEGEGTVGTSSFKDAHIGIVDAHPSSIYPIDDGAGTDEGGITGNCGIIPNNCLPCLVTTLPPNDKRKVLSPPNSAKKSSLKLSFKRKSVDGNIFSSRFSGKAVVERPLAGSQVQICLMEKKMLDSWSEVEPSTFRVRGENYFRDKKKVFAPNYAAYHPFGVDVYVCQQKINHITRFVELPAANLSGKLPHFLVVNVQIPLYPATLFLSETDGEGFSIVLYFKLSDNYMKELPAQFLENLRRLIDDEVERVKGFPMDTIVPLRERLKILGRVANVEDLPMSAAERKLMQAYNEKPVLSRPQHEFYLGENYFEIDIDMHRFSYISRKGFETFIDRLKLCILDVGLTIQGNKPEEVPEQILCCVRLNGIDYTNYFQLAVHYP